jgi:hypothetical protein
MAVAILPFLFRKNYLFVCLVVLVVLIVDVGALLFSTTTTTTPTRNYIALY